MSTRPAPDVIVVGGGPAGSASATTLAMRGYRVLLIEQQRHPRYHIGESLIPFCYYTLERLGLAERMKASLFIQKFSVQFVGISGAETRPFYFFEHLYHPAAVAWQVLRSDFDRMLLDNAIAKGVEVIEDCQVEELVLDGNLVVTGVRVRAADGTRRTLLAPMTIDASGRDALAPKQFGWRVLDDELNRFALWTYYTGAARDPGIDAGATTVAAVPQGGWFWYIPCTMTSFRLVWSIVGSGCSAVPTVRPSQTSMRSSSVPRRRTPGSLAIFPAASAATGTASPMSTRIVHPIAPAMACSSLAMHCPSSTRSFPRACIWP
jgi:flavin-dependent dehydrogenase